MSSQLTSNSELAEGTGCPLASGESNRRPPRRSALSQIIRGRFKTTAFVAGLVMGGGAAFIQAYLQIIPPPAYGICMVCHPKDLLNWLADHLIGTNWGNVTVSVDTPVLTVVGIILGALVAARQNGEFRLESAREPLFHFMTGFLVINFGLILGSCPIRIIIVSSYGSLIGILGYSSLVVGAVLGSIWLRRRARQQVRRRMVRA